MKKVISVVGESQIDVSPDIIIINMNIIIDDKNYDNLIFAGNIMYKSLIENLKLVEIDDKDIKTINYNINSIYDSILVEGIFENKFKNYRLAHQLRIELNLDMMLLSNVIKAITDSITNPDLNISFSVKEKDIYKNMLIQKAIDNAIDLAMIIVNKAGIILGDIKEINYGNINNTFLSNTAFDIGMVSKEIININPSPIKLKDNIQIQWYIN